MKRIQLFRVLALVALILLFPCEPALAKGFEVTPFVGARFGGGIPVSPFEADNGFVVAGLDLKSGAAFGVTFDASLTENVQLEFLWSRQDTTVRDTNAVNTDKIDLIDASVDQYHFNVLYQAGEEDDGIRPFVLAGLGASRFGPSGGFDAQTHLSIGFGGGVKLFFSDHLGLRVQGRWAPTHLGKDDVILCSINGCYETNV